MPRSLQELQHEHSHALADSSQSGAHGCRGFAFPRASIHDDETATDISHVLADVRFYIGGERISRPALSDGGQFGPMVDNNPPLLTFRFRLIKGLEREARERSLQLQVRTVISGSDEEELNSQA